MIERLIGELKAQQAALALEGLRAPREGTAFEFGRQVGAAQAFDRMLVMIENMLADKEEKERLR